MMASTHRMKLDATVAHHKPRLSKPLRANSGGAVYMTLTFMVTPVKYEKKMLLNDPSAVNFCFFLGFFSIIV